MKHKKHHRESRRKIINHLATGMATIAMGLSLTWLIWIISTVFYRGFYGLNIDIFTTMTPPPGSEGGLLNAIVGSIILTLGGLIIGAPLGIFTGIYLAEYHQEMPLLRSIIRFFNDILLSAPSIILGLYIYEIYVVRTGNFSALAGMMALSLIVIPIVVRVTEDTFRLIPPTLKENALALGATKYETIKRVLAIIARSGITTGVLLASARISGEAAPVLFTALNNQFWSVDVHKPMANLPSVIFQFAMSPYDDWQRLAWCGAMLITFWVLIINLIARFAFKRDPGIF